MAMSTFKYAEKCNSCARRIILEAEKTDSGIFQKVKMCPKITFCGF
jgi:hypothetical protein